MVGSLNVMTGFPLSCISPVDACDLINVHSAMQILWRHLIHDPAPLNNQGAAGKAGDELKVLFDEYHRDVAALSESAQRLGDVIYDRRLDSFRWLIE